MKDAKKDTKKKDAINEDNEVLDVLHKVKQMHKSKVSAPIKTLRGSTRTKTPAPAPAPVPAPAPAEQPAKKVAKYFQYKQCNNNFVISGRQQ